MSSDDHIHREVQRRIAAIRDDPERLMRYDINGDGRIDDEEWLAVERAVTLEVQTELERAKNGSGTSPSSPDLEGEALEVLKERFEIRDLLGEGSQGKTHLGYDRQTGEPVAIKELSIGDIEGWKAIELFEREGRTLRSLDHPRIPAYIDSFHLVAPDGKERFFLVQEFVDGENFETLMSQGLSMTEEEGRKFLRSILEILVYLQERSPPVIHRDIKPSNILRRQDGSLVLIDFGAVQSVIPDNEGGSTVIGTSGFMPFEQLYGRAVPATDLYALGATMVHLLSGRHPADLPLKEMRLEFESFVNCSPEFESLLSRLLEPIVERRIGTASEALAALEELDHPVQPSTDDPVQPGTDHPVRPGISGEEIARDPTPRPVGFIGFFVSNWEEIARNPIRSPLGVFGFFVFALALSGGAFIYDPDMRLLSILAGSMSAVGFVASAAVLQFLLYDCGPDEALVFLRREKSYQIVTGGRRVRLPFVESVARLELREIAVPISIRGAYSKGGIPLNVQAVASVKVSGNRPHIDRAIERFLGRGKQEIRRVAKETLEGQFRETLSTLTPEQVVESRHLLVEEVAREVEEDLSALGLLMPALPEVQDVSDDRGDLDSVGLTANSVREEAVR